MSRLDSRAYRWFVLCVPPQRELAVQKVMAREGFATFVPVAKEWKFTNAAARARMKKSEVKLPLMPRYVFLGMSDQTPGWGRVFCFTQFFAPRKEDDGQVWLERLGTPTYRPRRIITGVIGFNGRPYEVPHDTVKGQDGKPDRVGIRAFMLRHNAGKFNAPSHHKYMQTHREFEVGDMVETDDEAFTGQVIEIEDHKAVFEMMMFGRKVKTRISLENLVVVR